MLISFVVPFSLLQKVSHTKFPHPPQKNKKNFAILDPFRGQKLQNPVLGTNHSQLPSGFVLKNRYLVLTANLTLLVQQSIEHRECHQRTKLGGLIFG